MLPLSLHGLGTRGATGAEINDLRSLQEAASYGLEEIKSRLQSLALTFMAHEQETGPEALCLAQMEANIEEFTQLYFKAQDSFQLRPGITAAPNQLISGVSSPLRQGPALGQGGRVRLALCARIS